MFLFPLKNGGTHLSTVLSESAAGIIKQPFASLTCQNTLQTVLNGILYTETKDIYKEEKLRRVSVLQPWSITNQTTNA